MKAEVFYPYVASREIANQTEKDYAITVLEDMLVYNYPPMDSEHCTEKENHDRGICRWAIHLIETRIRDSAPWEDTKECFADVTSELRALVQKAAATEPAYKEFAKAYKTVKDVEWIFADDMNFSIKN